MMDTQMESVPLNVAYYWTCKTCARRNFALPDVMEVDEDEREEAYRFLHDIEDWQGLPDDWGDFEVYGIPKHVVCEKCAARFETIDYLDDE